MSFIKSFLLVAAILVTVTGCIYAGGLSDSNLVNTKSFSVSGLQSISVNYPSDNIKIFRDNGNSVVLKEYMSRNNTSFYAKTSQSGGRLAIERGNRRPWFYFNCRIEITIPYSFTGNLDVHVSSANIDATDLQGFSDLDLRSSSGSLRLGDITAAKAKLNSSSGTISIDSIEAQTINIENSSGGISVDTIEAQTINLTTNSGRIRCQSASGEIQAETSSGAATFEKIFGNIDIRTSSGTIKLNRIEGALRARSSSASIDCDVAKPTGDINITTNSGAVRLGLPDSSVFKFTAETSSGSIRTPFNDRLMSPLNDRSRAEGLINADRGTSDQINIDIRTSSGSINVSWL